MILAVHGFNDYSNAFDDFGAYRREPRHRGPRLRPERASAPTPMPAAGRASRPWSTTWCASASALAALYPDTPVYLLGESMGAAVLIAAVAESAPLECRRHDHDRARGLGRRSAQPASTAPRSGSRCTSRPALKLTGRGLGVMASDNIEMLRALGADPLFIKATRVDAIAGLVALMDSGAAPRRPRCRRRSWCWAARATRSCRRTRTLAMLGRLTRRALHRDRLPRRLAHAAARPAARGGLGRHPGLDRSARRCPRTLAKPCGGGAHAWPLQRCR